MRDKTKILTSVILLIVGSLTSFESSGQWSAPYANSWIDYNKPYVKIAIAKKGLHRIPLSSLPKTFPIDSPEKLQLWRRGKQISIISISNNEILFYAVTNDGTSDSLLYRPMSSRLNPHFSMYSDEGSYFLTVGTTSGYRAKTISQPVDGTVPLLPFHEEIVTTVSQEEYSLSTNASANKPSFLNSYFELAASRTGKADCTQIIKNFKLNNFVNISQKPKVKLLVHGRRDNIRKIGIYIGKTAKSLRLITELPNSGFNGTEYSFEFSQDDIDTDRNGVLLLKPTDKKGPDWISLAYYSITFPQLFQIENQQSKEFRLPPVTNPWSRISVKGGSASFTFLDISDVDHPIIIKGSAENLMIPRTTGKAQILLATNEVINTDPSKISDVKFKLFAPKETNYIIITTDSLYEGAKQYADYRTSDAGGSFKPLIADIKNIYDQFNYGEPSPLAIRKFMSYMLTEGGKDKYLFLIGKSITHNERMKRELPEEVPTIGYPGSDYLLIEGLAGAPTDIPALPVGRLSALNNQNIIDYLGKVKDYESKTSTDYSWRKNVLHLTGGKTVSELTQLKELLQVLEPTIKDGVIGGKVKSYIKQQAMEETETVNITSDINNGVGMITFFGHGSPALTDPDIGYITDAARGYNNLHKYPMMYFNGCGVGNIFSARYNTRPKNPKAGDRMPLSQDWLIAPNRGAIAIIASSFESVVSPAAKYLHRLYYYMFMDPATVNLPIGKIQMAVAKDIISKDKDKYIVASVHQNLLQGDPALKLVTVDKPDFAVDPDESITLLAQSATQSLQSSDSIRVSVKISNHGRYIGGQQVPVTITCFGRKGYVNKSESFAAFPSEKTLTVSFSNSKDIQRIQVQIDPRHLISELTTNNNVCELEIDWDLIKEKTSFSSENAKDNIPPILTARFNDRLIKNDEIIGVNPRITLSLTDDRQLFPDTSLIDIFLKPCNDDKCDFERISYSGHAMVLDTVGIRALRLTYPTKLQSGIYEILVNARDRSGNAVASPYRIRFEVVDQGNIRTKLVVSPNPASSYLRFELEVNKSHDLKPARYIIYDQRGMLVEDKYAPVHVGSPVSEWYWQPPLTASGLYSYKVFLTDSANTIFDTFTGKVLLVK
jgi:hypothetical protein